ncbi:hypothetical protein F2Q69_00053809 [Brassica cretica]|uniref:Uncharacterized protein n=1 Tax=Brassica cretica TaxID=69181 RepID=A0A8S9NA16_BRACR|nr:hypothetical protein F2Q69_00053809 [Brassica cretica]
MNTNLDHKNTGSNFDHMNINSDSDHMTLTLTILSLDENHDHVASDRNHKLNETPNDRRAANPTL